MRKSYLRGAIAALAMAALWGPFYGERSSFAMPVPAPHIDAFGYAGAISIAAPADVGSLVASSPVTHAASRPDTSRHSATNPKTATDGTALAMAARQISLLPSIDPLSSIRPDDLENQSLKSLYQLERLTTLAQPHLDATIFGGGLASQDYYLTDEGIQVEQSITEGIGIVGRATGYQLWIEKNSTSPLAPSNHTVNRLNFGRFEGGVDISPWQGFNFVLLGGHDVGDSDAWIIESDISMWFLLASAHPVNVFVAPVHDFQNDVTSSEIDFRVVATQTPDWILLLGVGGQIYGGGFISGLAGEGGPIVGIYNRIYQIGADLQFGYGSPGVYGELNIYKTFSFPGL